MLATEEEVRRQLGDISTDEVSSAVITQAIFQASNEVDAKKRSDALAVLIADAKIKLAAFYAWSAVIKSGRFELDTIREEGYDIMMKNYQTLAEAAVNLVSNNITVIATAYFPETGLDEE